MSSQSNLNQLYLPLSPFQFSSLFPPALPPPLRPDMAHKHGHGACHRRSHVDSARFLPRCVWSFVGRRRPAGRRGERGIRGMPRRASLRHLHGRLARVLRDHARSRACSDICGDERFDFCFGIQLKEGGDWLAMGCHLFFLLLPNLLTCSSSLFPPPTPPLPSPSHHQAGPSRSPRGGP